MRITGKLQISMGSMNRQNTCLLKHSLHMITAKHDMMM